MKIYLSIDSKNSNAVKKALDIVSEQLTLSIYRADYFNFEEAVIPQIIDSIGKADVFIADFSSDNPNIYYEVGIAHSANKPVIILTKANSVPKIPLPFNRVYNYNDDEKGIKKLAFVLSQILMDLNELESLKPLSNRKNILNFQESTNRNRLDEILNLTGYIKFREFESWIYSLLKEIPYFEVEKNAQRNGREYDFIVWNSNDSDELRGLGNPIPVEVKATKHIDTVILESLCGKAISQGFKSLILITTAGLTQTNKKLIEDFKTSSGIVILVLDRSALQNVSSSKDLMKAVITSFRKFFIY